MRPASARRAPPHARSSRGLGHEVHVYSTAVAGPPPAVHRVVTTLSVAGKRIPHRALGRARAYRYHDRRVALALRRLGDEIDVVHLLAAGDAATAAAAARRQGVPVLREAPNTHTAFAYERVAAGDRAARPRPPSPATPTRARGTPSRWRSRSTTAVDMIAVLSEYCRQTFLDRGHRARASRAARVRLRPRRASRVPASLDGRRRTGSVRFSSAAASRARGSTTRSRPGSSRAPPSAARSRSAAASTPATTRSSHPGCDTPSVTRAGLGPRPRRADAGERRLRLPVDRGGERARHVRGAGERLRLVVSDAAGARCEHLRARTRARGRRPRRRSRSTSACSTGTRPPADAARRRGTPARRDDAHLGALGRRDRAASTGSCWRDEQGHDRRARLRGAVAPARALARRAARPLGPDGEGRLRAAHVGHPADHGPGLVLHDGEPHARATSASTASATARTTPTTGSSSPTRRRSRSRASGTTPRAAGSPRSSSASPAPTPRARSTA